MGLLKEELAMARKQYTAEQIIGKLREVEVLLSQGKTQEQAIRAIGVTGNTYYRWRKEYGGLKLDQAKRLKDLEAENTRLKRAVAELTVDNQILKEVSKGKF
jgi:transposase-like protein